MARMPLRDGPGRLTFRSTLPLLIALVQVAGCASTGSTGKNTGNTTETFKDQFDFSLETVIQPFYPAYGTIAINKLRPEYEPPKAQAARTWDLAKLARDTDTEHRIVPGELLAVSCSDLVEELHTATFPVHVGDDGTVALPLLPQRVPVGLLTAAEAERAIASAYVGAHLIRQPHLTIRTLEYRTSTIYVIGAVKKPGAYELQPDDCDPLRAIVAAGGTTPEANNIIEVRRGRQPAAEAAQSPTGLTLPAARTGAANDDVVRFDLTQDIARNASQLRLQNGDIVSVEQKKLRPIHVVGSVNKPGEFPMPADRDIRVLEAVGLAGGVFTISEPTVALIIRRPKGRDAVVMHVNLRQAAKNPDENPRLMEGDIVTVVEDTPSRLRKIIRTYFGFGTYLPIP